PSRTNARASRPGRRSPRAASPRSKLYETTASTRREHAGRRVRSLMALLALHRRPILHPALPEADARAPPEQGFPWLRAAPQDAMSGGALIALSGDEIVMDPNAVLGPVDPQLGNQQAAYPAASIIRALAQPNPNRDDQTLILGDVAEKALRQVTATVKRLLLEHYSEADAERIANKLSSGEWTHDYALDVAGLRELGIKVTEDMPREVYELMDLFPQTSQRRPSVEFIPLPYTSPPPAVRPRGDRSS